MFEILAQVAKSNPVLLAGIGTVFFGSAMYVVRGVPAWLLGVAKRFLTIEIIVVWLRTADRG